MYSCKLLFVVCLTTGSVSDIDSDQSVDSDGYLTDVSSDSYSSLYFIPRARLFLPASRVHGRKQYGSEPRRRKRRVTETTSPLPTLDTSSDADDESQEEPCRRRKNHLARRLRIHQFLVHGPAFANMRFDRAYRWRLKLADDTPSPKIKTPKYISYKIRNRNAENKVRFASETIERCFKKPDLLLRRLVDIFLERIRKVVDSNYASFCRIMRTIKRDPERLIRLITMENWGLTVQDILAKIFETITGEQSENFISFVVSILLNNDLFEQRRVQAKEKLYWMLRASKYRRWTNEYTSSSD